jgi:uncharacterized membrane protein YdjX (TVP38/TMEM64 family)
LNSLAELFQQYPGAAIAISIIASILIAIAGLIPSVFITAANIFYFGVIEGTIISLAGEAAGALISFLLYRYGFKKATVAKLSKYPKAMQLVNAEGSKAFLLVLFLRLIPFVPSGIITFTAAIGKMRLLPFFIASTLGKIPAIIIEAYSVYQVRDFGWQGKMILAVTAGAVIWFIIKKR